MLYLNKMKIIPTIFPDKTSQIWKIEGIEDIKEFNIQWKFEKEDEIFHLCQLWDLINAYGYEPSLRIEYLPCGRQDKSVSNNTTFALHTLIRILNSMKFKKVEIVDPHSFNYLAINNSFAVYPIKEIKKVFKITNSNCVCYPDKGAKEKYTDLYKHIDKCFESPIIGEKVRDQETGWITSYKFNGDVKNKNILIIDDICDGGATFNLLSEQLKKSGCNSINLFVTHGIFSNGLKHLRKNINKIFTMNHEIEEYGSNFLMKTY